MNLNEINIPKKLISIACISPLIGRISNSYKNSCLRAMANKNDAIVVKRLPNVSLRVKRLINLVIILYTCFLNSNTNAYPNSLIHMAALKQLVVT